MHLPPLPAAQRVDAPQSHITPIKTETVINSCHAGHRIITIADGQYAGQKIYIIDGAPYGTLTVTATFAPSAQSTCEISEHDTHAYIWTGTFWKKLGVVL